MLRPSPLLLALPNRSKKYLPKMHHDGEINPLAKATVIDPKVLYLVTVPIGNLKDFTLRALDVLRSVDYIVCADKPATRVLLDMIDIDHSGRLIQFNRSAESHGRLVELIRSGSSAAFVVSQGTPVVGDVGTVLVRDMMAGGVRVSVVPGADACTTALAMSGASMAADAGSFRFGSYLSTKRGQRLGELRIAAAVTYPSVYFEAAPRLLETLSDIAVVAPQRRVAVVHEMTKVHEATHAGTVEQMIRYYQRSAMAQALRRGQLTIVMDGAVPTSKHDAAAAEAQPRAASLLASAADTRVRPSVGHVGTGSVGIDAEDRIGVGSGRGAASTPTNEGASLEQSFAHFSVAKQIAMLVREGTDGEDAALHEAVRRVAPALMMPAEKVRRLFEAEEQRLAASGDVNPLDVFLVNELDEAVPDASATMSHDQTAVRLTGEPSAVAQGGHAVAEPRPRTTSPTESAAVEALPHWRLPRDHNTGGEDMVVPVGGRTGETDVEVHRFTKEGAGAKTLKELRRRADREAAEHFLRLRVRLRGESEDEQERVQNAVAAAEARGGVTGLVDHTPDDWEPESPSGAAAADSVEDARREDLARVRAEYEPESDSDAGSESRVVAEGDDDGEDASATDGTKKKASGKGKGKRRKKKGGLSERLRLQRLVDAHREEVRLMQMGMGASIAQRHEQQQHADATSARPPSGSFGSPRQPPSTV